jgi:hypothetical protein
LAIAVKNPFSVLLALEKSPKVSVLEADPFKGVRIVDLAIFLRFHAELA